MRKRRQDSTIVNHSYQLPTSRGVVRICPILPVLCDKFATNPLPYYLIWVDKLPGQITDADVYLQSMVAGAGYGTLPVVFNLAA